jgi:hypothetical protein
MLQTVHVVQVLVDDHPAVGVTYLIGTGCSNSWPPVHLQPHEERVLSSEILRYLMKRSMLEVMYRILCVVCHLLSNLLSFSSTIILVC